MGVVLTVSNFWKRGTVSLEIPVYQNYLAETRHTRRDGVSLRWRKGAIIANIIETWGKDNPVRLTVISVIVGAVLGTLISFYPVELRCLYAGRDAGVAATETSWQKKFDAMVADKVKEQVPIEFKKELDDANAQI